MSLRPLHVPLRFLVLAALLLSAAWARQRWGIVMVRGGSMKPTLRSGDILLVHHAAYRREPPRRGDVVLIRYGRELLIKRVIALPGEHVEVRHGRVHVNGVPRDYVDAAEALNIGPGILGPGRYAALGDNRDPLHPTLHVVVPGESILGRVEPLVALRLRGGDPAAEGDPGPLRLSGLGASIEGARRAPGGR